MIAVAAERIAVESYPAERDVLRLEKARESGEVVSRQINPVHSPQRPPGVVGDRLDLRIADVHPGTVGEVVSRFQEFQRAAGEPQIEPSVSGRRLVRVGEVVRQAVERSGWTGDLERAIVRTFNAGTAFRAKFCHFAHQKIKRNVDHLETRKYSYISSQR